MEDTRLAVPAPHLTPFSWQVSEQGAVLTNSDPTLVFTFLAIFSISSISFNFMVSTFFSRGEFLPARFLAGLGGLAMQCPGGCAVRPLINFGWEGVLEVNSACKAGPDPELHEVAEG